MAIFISYSHEDRGFVEKLAQNLVLRKARVWIDRWELEVGDSLVSRVQEAIESSSALLVIMSEAAVRSEWCRRELSAGLLRELEERRVVVLPVRVDDCTFPIFLRDKVYADFRTSFDQGLEAVLEGIASVTAEGLGTIDRPEFHVDWSMDWGYLGERFLVKFLLVEHISGTPATAVTEVNVLADDGATARYREYEREGLDWWARQLVLELIRESVASRDLHVILTDQKPKTIEMGLRDPELDLGYGIHVESRRVGNDSGKDLLIDIGGQLAVIGEASRERFRKPTPDEWIRIGEVMTRLGTIRR
ncbi:MAG: toll/interleukin-1 receptor domain-containing protein [Polyangiaceae bacterium]|nr:toll/interleukin-1 receptor domain-containing protein [Polyangiaceae bacterium]